MNDLISRNAVEHLIMTSNYNLGHPIQKGLMMHKIESIPSMDRHKGDWIDDDRHNHKYHRCSCCGLGRFNWGEDNFCPNCGADMRGTENEATSSL